MDPVRMAAVGTVTLALLLYTVGTIAEQRTHRVGGTVRGFLTVGVFFDVTATILMIVASRSLAPTVHGMLGYSALALMVVDTSLLWRHSRTRAGQTVGRRLHLFSRFAYGYWVLAYFTGAALVMAERAAAR